MVSIKKQYRNVPDGGLGFGIACYVNNHTELLNLNEQSICSALEFNFLGDLDRVLPKNDVIAQSEENFGKMRSPLQQQQSLICITGMFINDRLQFSFTFLPTRISEHSVSALADKFKCSLEEMVTTSVISAHATEMEYGHSTKEPKVVVI
jgi:non-ribosomal peptide synthase protein (TIGR01720 family)